MPINCTSKFAVKASSCLREHFLRITTLPVKSSPTKGKTVLPKSIPSTCRFIECLLPRTLQLLEIRGGPSHYLAVGPDGQIHPNRGMQSSVSEGMGSDSRRVYSCFNRHFEKHYRINRLEGVASTGCAGTSSRQLA